MAETATKDYLTFDEYCNQHLIYSTQVGFLHHFVEEWLCKVNKSYVDYKLVGSAFQRRYGEISFWGPVSAMTRQQALDSFFKTDYDFAVKLDSFLLEAMLNACPSLAEVPQDSANPYDTTGLLKCVYTTTVGDLLASGPDILSQVQRTRVRSRFVDDLHKMEEFLQQEVQFLFVKDLSAIRKIWDSVDREAFAAYYWKRSPTFIGKDALKFVFKNFEDLAVTKKSTLGKVKVTTSDSVFEPAPAPEPVDMWQVQAAPAVGGAFGGQAVDVVWIDEEPNMAAEAQF